MPTLISGRELKLAEIGLNLLILLAKVSENVKLLKNPSIDNNDNQKKAMEKSRVLYETCVTSRVTRSTVTSIKKSNMIPSASLRC